MIYDCFQFFNEIDVLLIRLNTLKDVVDKFVISEATVTFSNNPKPLNLKDNWDLIKEFEDKIIYRVCDDTPVGYSHDMDQFQKNAVGRGLTDAKDDDIIIFSDLDEIPNPDTLRTVIDRIRANENDDASRVYHLAQRMFYCYLNMEEVTGKLLSFTGEFDGVEHNMWLGAKVIRYDLLKNRGIELYDLRRAEAKEYGVRVSDGGWHFGYMGGHNVLSVADRVADKVRSAAHQEVNNSRVLREAVDNINDGRDMFGRDARFVRVPIDDSFPKYVRDNQDMLKHLIKAEDRFFEGLMRKFRIAYHYRLHRFNGAVYSIFCKLKGSTN